MVQVIDGPDGTTHEFPDTAKPSDVQNALTSVYGENIPHIGNLRLGAQGPTIDDLIDGINRVEGGGPGVKAKGSSATGTGQIINANTNKPAWGIPPIKDRNDPNQVRDFQRNFIAAAMDRGATPEEAITAYNRGPTAYDKWAANGKPQDSTFYKQGQKYLQKVLSAVQPQPTPEQEAEAPESPGQSAPPAPEGEGAFKAGLRETILSQSPHDVAGFLHMAGQLTGIQKLHEAGDWINKQVADTGINPDRIRSLRDLGDHPKLDDVASLAGYWAGSLAGGTAPYLAAAAAGTAVGGPVGTFAAPAALGAVQFSGGFYNQLLDEGVDPKKAAPYAATFGAVAGPLNAVTLGSIIKGAGRPVEEAGIGALAKWVGARIADGSAKQTITQGITQNLQNTLDANATNTGTFDTDHLWRLADATVMGAMGGGLTEGGLALGHHALNKLVPPAEEAARNNATPHPNAGQPIRYQDATGAWQDDRISGQTTVNGQPHIVMQSGAVVDATKVQSVNQGAKGYMPGPNGFVMRDPQPEPVPGGLGPGNYPVPMTIPQPGSFPPPAVTAGGVDPGAPLRTPGSNSGVMVGPNVPPEIPGAARPVALLEQPGILSPNPASRTQGPNSGTLIPPLPDPLHAMPQRLGVAPLAPQPGMAIMPMPGNENAPGLPPPTPALLPPPSATNRPPAPTVPTENQHPVADAGLESQAAPIAAAPPINAEAKAAALAQPSFNRPNMAALEYYVGGPDSGGTDALTKKFAQDVGLVSPEGKRTPLGTDFMQTMQNAHAEAKANGTANPMGVHPDRDSIAMQFLRNSQEGFVDKAAANPIAPSGGDVRAGLKPSMGGREFNAWAEAKRLGYDRGDMTRQYGIYKDTFQRAVQGMADKDPDAQLAEIDRQRKATSSPVKKMALVDAYQQLSGAVEPAKSINLRDPQAWTRMHSALESAVDGVPRTEMTGREWYDYLTKRSGINPDEMRLMGLEDALKRNSNTFNQETMRDIVSNAKAAMARPDNIETHPEVRNGKKTLVIDSGLPTDEYAARRMLAYAARGGFDHIAWTPRMSVHDELASRLLADTSASWGGQRAGKDAKGDFTFKVPHRLSDGIDTASVAGKQLTPMAMRARQQLMKDITNLVHSVAPMADLRFETLSHTDRTVPFSGEQWANLLHVALGTGMEATTAMHEAMHYLERSGFFRPDEMRILDQNTQRLHDFALKEYPEHKEQLANHMLNAPWEARAIGIEAYLKAKIEGRPEKFNDFPAPLAHILDKIANLFEKIKNWAAGRGFQSLNDVFDRVISGEVGHRDIQYAYDVPSIRAFHAIAANEMGTSSKAFMDKFGQTKVRDDFGRPGILYTKYEPFSGDPIAHSDAGHMGPGYYFSRTPEEHAKMVGKDAKVQPAFIAIKNPLDLRQVATMEHKLALSKSLGLVQQALRPQDVMKAKSVIRSAKSLQDIADADHPIATALLGRLARQLENDGIKFLHDGDEHWVAFDRKQLTPPIDLNSPGIAERDLSNTLASLLRKPAGTYNYADSHDIGLISHYVYTKRQLAITQPHFTDVYMHANSMLHHRSETIQSAAMTASPYGQLIDRNPKAIRDVHAAAELARLQGLKLEPNANGEIIVANQARHTDLSRLGDVIHLDTPEKVKAYQALTNASREVLVRMRQAMLGVDPNNDKISNTIGGVKIDENTTYKDLSDWAQRAQDLMKHPEIAKNKEAMDHLETVSKQFRSLANDIGKLDQLMKSDYVPFARFGQYGMIIEDKDTHTAKHFEMFEGTTMSHGKRLNMAKVNARISELLARYPNSQVRRPEGGGAALFHITHDEIKSLVGQGLASFDMIAGILGSSDKASYEKIRDVLAEALRQRSFRAHMTPAEMTPGYSTEFDRSLANYVVGGSGYASRLLYGPHVEEAIGKIPKEMPKLIETAMSYKDYVMSPVEEHSFLKGLGFMWFLGGNVSSALVQLTNVPMLSAPHLAQFTNFGRANYELLKGFKDTGKIIAKTSAIWMKHFAAGGERPIEPYIGMDMNHPGILGFLPADEQAALKRAWNDGSLKPMLAIQQVGLTPSMESLAPRNVLKNWHGAMSRLASMFGTMESAGRITQFLAYYRMAMKDPTVLDHADNVYQKNALYQKQVGSITDRAEKAYQFASFANDDIMSNTSKANRAPYQEGHGGLVFQFQGWVHAIMETLANMATMQGAAGKKAFALASMWMLAMGGAFGLPAADDLRVVFEGIYHKVTREDIDLKREMRTGIVAFTHNKSIADFIVRGMDGTLGVATGPRVSLGKTPANDILQGMFGDAEVDDFGGPVGTILHGNFSAYNERVLAGESKWTASREFMPLFIKNALEGAFIWNSQGYRTRGNDVVTPVNKLDGTPNITPQERLLRGMGFMPSKEATDRDIYATQHRGLDKYAQAKEQLEKKLQNAYADQMAAFYNNDNAKLRSARDTVEAMHKKLQDYNTEHQHTPGYIPTTEQQLRQLQREAIMQRNPAMRFPLEAGRAGRESIANIRKLYPEGTYSNE